MFSLIKKLFGAGERTLAAILSGTKEERAAQARLNEAEIGGAPVSRLRLWRSFLGWALSLALCWEIVRVFIAHYVPDASLPPSMSTEIISLLSGMLGLGL